MSIFYICSHLRDLLDADVCLLFKVELYANNMTDGPPSTLLVPRTRLDCLLQYQRHLQQPELSIFYSVPFPRLPPATEYQSVIKIKGTILITWRILGDYIRFIQLPSPSCFLHDGYFKLPDVQILHLAIDPYQDLLATLEVSNQQQ